MNREDTNFLRFIAICLVLNSHLDLYYPIDHIGTGGAIGNSLFFMLSSFGLFLSEKKNPQSFRVYYTKRIRRIYASLWLILILLILPVQILNSTIDAHKVFIFLLKFIYPPFWFLQALLLFYFIGFFLIKNYNHTKVIFAMAAAFALYLFVYLTYLDLSIFSIETMPFRLLFYVQVFMLGILLSGINEKIRFHGTRDIVICVISILVMYGSKYLMSKHVGSNMQLIQHFAIMVLVFYALKISRSSLISKRIMHLHGVGAIIRYISQITLELYIVHVTISPLILRYKLAFPVNVAVFIGSTFLLAGMFHWAASQVLNYRAVRLTMSN